MLIILVQNIKGCLQNVCIKLGVNQLNSSLSIAIVKCGAIPMGVFLKCKWLGTECITLSYLFNYVSTLRPCV